MKSILKEACYLALFLMGSYILGYLIFSPAFGHDFYDIVCCSNHDCKPIPGADIKATPTGWYVTATGETFPYSGDYRVKPSPDGRYHRCAAAGDFSSTGRTLCIYVPPMAY